MPSTNTITAFYSFQPDTVIYSAQINNNFSTFRGNILPVDPNTATAVNNTYNLGSSDYKWANLYCSNIIGLTAPTVQTFTSGSGTYTTPANVKFIIVELVGAGGGGAGSGTSGTGGSGGTGGNTTFGTSLLTANGGSAGATWAVGAAGNGGTYTINSPAITMLAVNGSAGMSGAFQSTAIAGSPGGIGGTSFFGGSGKGSTTVAGGAASTNSGSGGGGAGIGSFANASSGGGGGSGAYIKALIVSPSATYSYSVGTAGTAGTAGTSGYAGGAGAAGIIVVTEFY